MPSACYEFGEFAIIQVAASYVLGGHHVFLGLHKGAELRRLQMDAQVCVHTYRLTVIKCLLASNYASFRVTE